VLGGGRNTLGEQVIEALQRSARFEKALGLLSARFIAAPKDGIDAAIEEALHVIGETLQFTRSAVFLLDPPGYLKLHYAWCAPGVRGFRSTTCRLSIAEFGWPLTDVAAGRFIVLDMTELPADALHARRVFARDGLAIVVAVPLLIEQALVGCVT